MTGYRNKLLRWMHQREIDGKKTTLKDISAASGISWTVLQRIASGSQKDFKAETLKKIGVGIGQGADFFFREEVSETLVARETRAEYTAEKEHLARVLFAHIHAEFGQDTFTLVLPGFDHDQIAIVYRDGRLMYCDRERRKREGRER